MSEILEFNKRARVREEASLWLTRMQEDVSAEQQQQLLEWLAADKEHERELLELAIVWDELEVLTELAPLFEGVSTDSSRHVEGPLNTSRSQEPKLPWTRLGVAASLLIVTILIAGYHFSGSQRSDSQISRASRSNVDPSDQISSVADSTKHMLYKTSIGEQLEIKLKDGSIATLNTDTQMLVNFTPTQRVIRLLQGEAHFDVFRDSKRPLKVLVSGKSVQAIGTAFSVRKKGGSEIEVAVDKGLVAVYEITPDSNKDGESSLRASLDAGDVLTIADEQPQLIEYGLDEMEDRLAWREGMIVINDETLDYVINEFGRYSEHKVLLADRKMGEIRVAGYFRLGDVDALLVALEKNFKIHSEYYESNNTFVLSHLVETSK